MENLILSILFCVALGWIVERAQLIMCIANYETPYNGYGAIEGVIRRRGGDYPTNYRVFVPWLVWLIEKLKLPGGRNVWYEAIKIGLNALAIGAVWHVWGFTTALVFCVFLLLTFKYDYWDWANEVVGLATAMSGNLPLALAGTVFHALGRETVFLTAVAYVSRTGDWAGGALLFLTGGVTLLLVHLWCDRGKLLKVQTTSRFYFVKLSWQKIKDIPKVIPWFFGEMFIAVVMTVFIVGVLVGVRPVGWLAPLGIVVASWTMAQPEETRVFTACLPWLAAWIAGGM